MDPTIKKEKRLKRRQRERAKKHSNMGTQKPIAPINSASNQRKFAKHQKDIKSPDFYSKQNCPICIARIRVGGQFKTKCCKKYIHMDCAIQWLHKSNNNKCPLCRGALCEMPNENNCSDSYESDSYESDSY